MMRIECYEAHGVKPNDDFFFGGHGSDREYISECFDNEEDAKKWVEEKLSNPSKVSCGIKWWERDYVNKDFFYVEKVVKEF